MNTFRPTSSGRQPHRNFSLPGETIRHLARASALFVFSGAATLALLHFLLPRIAGRPVPWDAVLRPDLLWPTLALAAAVTLANYAMLSLLGWSTDHTSSDGSDNVKTTTAAPAAPDADATAHQLKHLNRSAERLDVVEQDLIRKISHTYPMDTLTRQLLTEMRICTNRLRGELIDIERQEPGERDSSNRVAGSGERRDQHSTAVVRSDVKLDHVPIG